MIEFGNEKSKILFFGVDIIIDRELDNCNFPFDIKKEIAKEGFSKYLRKLFTLLKLTEENYFITALPRKKDELDLSEKDEDDFVDYITQKISEQEPKLLIGIGELARELLNLEEYGVLEKTKKGHKIAIWHPLIVHMDKGDSYDEWYEQIEPSIPLIKEFIKEKTDEVKKLSKCQEFVHLHIHDEYSLLDGYGTVEEYAQAAKERGWKHLAITNHGMLGQMPRQYNICKELGLNAIYGCEVYLNDYRDLREYNIKAAKDLPLPEGFDSLEDLQNKFRKNYHLTLLAKNDVGLSNLIKLTSDAWINGFYRRPRTTHEQIEKYSEGLLCGTACYAGPISQSILDGDINRAYKAAEYYKGVFGKDFFLELMLLDIEEQQKVNAELVRMSKDLDIDLVVTSDCHYVKKDDSYYQDVMLLIQTNNKIKDLQDNPDNIFTFHSKELWYKTAEDLDKTYEDLYTEIVPRDVYEQAKKNSIKFADRCKVEIDTSLKIADYDDIGDYESSYEYLEHLAFEGLKQRGKDNQKYIDRLKMELDVIKRKNYSGYFLIVWDMVKWSWENDIWVGVGRGSAAGALLCYVLRITDVDPLQFNLFFERFLNEARQDMPDIDIDFEPYGRDDIKDYIIQRYGRNKTCAIGTYGTYQTRASIGDVCRVFDVPLVTSRIITKQLTSDVDLMDKEEAEKTYGQLFEPLKDHRYKQVVKRKTEQKELNPYDTFWNIRGRIRNISAHAAGFIISKHDLTGNLPLVTRKSNVLSAWIEGKRGAELSSFGFVKYDILGLLNLTFIKDALKIIKERHGRDVDVHNDIDSNLNDPKIYEQIMLGNGNLIFQFESPMMRKLLRDSKCDSFDCLAAITALGRPGPLQSGMTDEFCKRKLGKSKYKIHPLLEEVLGYTYGIVVYQEQIMQIANKIADFTLVETDILRKLLTKVKGSVKTVQWKKLQEYKKKFIENGKKHLPVKELEKLFDGFLKWAGYGFNKCLTGDTIVIRSNGNQHAKKHATIKELYNKLHSKTSTGKLYRNDGLPKIWAMKSGKIKIDKIKTIHNNGIQDVYKIKTKNNIIRATKNHRFLSINGWKEVKDFKVGDLIGIKGEYIKYTKKGRVSSAKGNIYKGLKGGLGFGLDDNNPAYIDWRLLLFNRNKEILKSKYNNCQKCNKPHKRLEIHHKKLIEDFNYNYLEYHSLENMILICPSCYKKEHYDKFNRIKRYEKGIDIEFEEVVEKFYDGKEEIFDLEMYGEEHNFIANNFISHNSHAVSYTVISYRCAWLRTYYPKEYICAVLKNIPKDEAKYESYIREAKKLGIEIINVDINRSNLNFRIDGNSILIGFINLKGTGADPAAEISMKRPFTSLDDFIERTIKQKGKTKVSKRVMMPLILVGAFDEFGDRIEILFKYYKKCQNRKNFLVGEHGRLAKERDKNPVSDTICTVIEKITNNLTIDIKNLDIDDMNLEEYKLSDEDNDKFTNTILGFELINKMNLLKIDVKKYGTIEDIKDNGYGASIGVVKRIEDGETKAGRKFYKVGIEDDNSFVNLKIWDSVRDRFKDEVKLGRIVYFAVSRYSVYSFRPCTLNSFIHVTRDMEEIDSIIDKNNIEYTRRRTKELDKVKSEDRYLKTLIECEEMTIGHPKLCFGMINNIELSGKLVYATLYDEGYSIDLKAWLNVAEDIGLINADVHDGDFVKVKARRDNDFAGMKTFFIENILKLKAELA